MRVIAGSLGGRTFASPHGHKTHPMSEKARGAIFNALGDVEGLTVLDVFAGSGALSIEALSRGSSGAVAVDNDKNACRTMRENAALLGLKPNLTVIQQNAASWSENSTDTKFDIIFADPPYDNLQPAIAQKLPRHLGADSILVLSWPGGEELPEIQGTTSVARKDFGDIQIGFYRRDHD